MLAWMGRTALEPIGQAGLGYSFDNFVEDLTDPYGESVKQFLCVASHVFLPVPVAINSANLNLSLAWVNDIEP